jgi:hypothetical protein
VYEVINSPLTHVSGQRRSEREGQRPFCVEGLVT